jgi:hypothetical protein
MQRLQQLEVYNPNGLNAFKQHGDEFLAALPPSLTALTLYSVDLTPSPAVSAQLSRLTALRALQLEQLGLEPQVLTCWTRLEHLELSAVYSKPATVSSSEVCYAEVCYGGLIGRGLCV